jgi:beta-glucosidase
MKKKSITWLLAIIFCHFVWPALAQKKGAVPTYKNPAKSIDARVNDLLKRMTLDEKIGQMTQLCVSSITLDGTKTLDLNLDKIREYILNDHVGSFLSGTGSAERWVSFITAIQKVAMTETRLGIPIIFGMDNVHGANYTNEATILPHNLNLACSFNTELAAAAARITAIESADLGHAWNFAPVLDVGKNPYWPRLYETFGEDPLVCAAFGATYIQTFQNLKEIEPYKLAACGKHFIGYSDPKSGWDRTPSEIPEQVLQEMFLPPFKAAVKAGVKTIMLNSGELNGEPVHGSVKYVKGMLREQLGFNGVIVTDIKDIVKMVEMHKAARTEKEATLMAINAGIDVHMACNSTDFCQIMKELVSEKKITVKRIDESVKRILRLKFELGLFEQPYPSSNRLQLIGNKTHLEAAERMAAESIVLLKNEHDILPLKKNLKKVVIAGFASNSKRNLNGAWTFEWLGAEEERQPKQMETLLSALKKEMPGTFIQHIDSADVFGSKGYFRFIGTVNDADAIILTVGESPYSEFKGNMESLQLDEHQRNMIKVAQLSGKPVILIVIAGRPRVLSDVSKDCKAILFAGHPGQGGAPAIAKILTGKINPSGRLAFSYPGQVGHNVPYYHKHSERSTAEWPFGHGLSYSKLSYGNMSISDTVINTLSKTTKATITVYNDSKLPVQETMFWYLSDQVAPITRPVKKLVHFEKKWIQPNDSVVFQYSFNPALVAGYPDEQGRIRIDNGKFSIMAGNVKQNITLSLPDLNSKKSQKFIKGKGIKSGTR